MATYAVIEKSKIVNIIECDDPQVLPIILPDVDAIVEATDITGYPYIGGEYKLDKFVPPQPYGSWSFDEDKWQWIAPVSYPTDGKPYEWDEKTQFWKEIIFKVTE